MFLDGALQKHNKNINMSSPPLLWYNFVLCTAITSVFPRTGKSICVYCTRVVYMKTLPIWCAKHIYIAAVVCGVRPCASVVRMYARASATTLKPVFRLGLQKKKVHTRLRAEGEQIIFVRRHATERGATFAEHNTQSDSIPFSCSKNALSMFKIRA